MVMDYPKMVCYRQIEIENEDKRGDLDITRTTSLLINLECFPKVTVIAGHRPLQSSALLISCHWHPLHHLHPCRSPSQSDHNDHMQ